MPCITQSDPGTENYNVAYVHTHICHALNPTLTGSIQHSWKHGHTNIKPEQMWWRFHRTWVCGFEKLLEEGVWEQWYNTVNIANRYVLQYLHKIPNLWNIAGWSFVGWLYLGSRRRLIRMYTTIIQAEEGQVIARSCPMVFQMLCSKTQKVLTLATSR